MALCFSCNISQIVDSSPEPADPDTYDMSLWEGIETGIRSGFGSTDVAYSKSIPPSGDLSESIYLQGWKGERVSCKLLVWSAETAQNIRISSTGLNGEGSEISEEAITISLVKYVLTDQFLNENGGACGIPQPNNFTFSPPSESCFEGWIASAMGFDGFLRWAYNSWPVNPMIDSRYVKWPAGDTYFIYPGPLSSVRFERLREGIQDYEKIRILREDLTRSTSTEAIAAISKLDEFMSTIDAKTLDKKSAAEVIHEGKQLINEITKTAF